MPFLVLLNQILYHGFLKVSLTITQTAMITRRVEIEQQWTRIMTQSRHIHGLFLLRSHPVSPPPAADVTVVGGWLRVYRQCLSLLLAAAILRRTLWTSEPHHTAPCAAVKRKTSVGIIWPLNESARTMLSILRSSEALPGETFELF